jgi:hypothetical protein
VKRELTALGVVVNTYYWIKRHRDQFGPAAEPILASCIEVMERECPSTLKEVERHA